MEDVIGSYTDPIRFRTFLDDWEVILARRVQQAVATISRIEGIQGLILAGSNGTGHPWPLSDIDLLPIFNDTHLAIAQDEVERIRLALIDAWTVDGWWTGVDIGRLHFTADELRRVLGSDALDLRHQLQDDRWYHSLDKGYGGRAVYDPTGLAAKLAEWFTTHRFDPQVVRLRLNRVQQETATARQHLASAIASGDLLGGYASLFMVVKWLQIEYLERWGERDNSFGRVGTRFERAAAVHHRGDLISRLNEISGLDDASVAHRMSAVPDWVRERRDRSWLARRQINEPVTRVQNDRDVLRVSTYYELKRAPSPPFPAWLGIPSSIADLTDRATDLSSLIDVAAIKQPDS